jgi:hypothetical protein
MTQCGVSENMQMTAKPIVIRKTPFGQCRLGFPESFMAILANLCGGGTFQVIFGYTSFMHQDLVGVCF